MNTTRAGIITIEPEDLSSYRQITVIGDLHGCCTVLKEALGDDGLRDDTLYIFVGDYLDRGIENREVLEFLIANYTRKNCRFLEGNHEAYLRKYANDEEYRSSEFTYRTLPQISMIPKKDIRQFCRRLRQCAYFTHTGRTFLICHGGISAIPPLGLAAVSTSTLINGSGRYQDCTATAASWAAHESPDFIQIYGHRSDGVSPARLHRNVICLEGGVEYGKCLRTAQITAGGIETREYQNTVYDKVMATGIPDLIRELRRSPYIQEKNFGDISSFNFTDKAFQKGIWDEQTVTARGLFLDVASAAVVARGYRKFFNIDEREETRLPALAQSLQYPLKVYVKENGFLGLVSSWHGELFVTTKSNPWGEHGGYLREILGNSCPDQEVLRKYLEERNLTLALECIDPKRDPHIIRYGKPEVVLLDLIKNQLEFARESQEELESLGQRLGLRVKSRRKDIANGEEFLAWHQEVTRESLDPRSEHIEGYVIEDAAGYMVKIKLPFYTQWKILRSVADLAFSQTPPKRTLGKKAARFHQWLTGKVRDGLERTNIIELRDMYVRETGDLMDD